MHLGTFATKKTFTSLVDTIADNETPEKVAHRVVQEPVNHRRWATDIYHRLAGGDPYMWKDAARRYPHISNNEHGRGFFKKVLTILRHSTMERFR